MSAVRAGGLAAALAMLIAAAWLCATAPAGEFVVQLCQQRNRSLDGIPGQVSTFGGDVDERCDPAGAGLAVTPPGGGLAGGASVGLSLVPAAVDARILRSVLWSHSFTASSGLVLSIVAQRSNVGTAVRPEGTPGADQIGGGDQSSIGSTLEAYDFRANPVDRLDYVARCARAESCAGGIASAVVRLYGAELTIQDTTAPSTGAVGWPEGPVSGTGTVTVDAGDDGSGIRVVKLFVDGREVAASAGQCDLRRIRPCPAHQRASLSFDAAGLGGGYRAAQVQVFDGSGELATRTGSIFIDDRQAPRNRVAPAIANDARPRAGDTLTADPGEWTGTGLSFGYQWSRCDDDRCAPVTDARSSRYHLTRSDLRKQMTVEVTATADSGREGLAASARTAVVQDYRLESRSPPNVGGTAAIGRTLTATPGEWRGTGALKLSYRWKRCRAKRCTPIATARALSYTVRRADLGASLRLEVTGRDATGASVRARSEPIGPVRAMSPGARLLPRPFVRVLTRVSGRAGEEFYRLVRVTLGALERGSRIEVACRARCTRLGRIAARRARGTRLTVSFTPSVQYVPGARITVSAVRAGRVGRIRHIILTSRRPVLEPMRCLGGSTGRQERSCSGA